MDKAAYISKYEAESARIKSTADPLTGLLGATAISYQALGSMVDMFDGLSTVAPDKIERQVKAVRDSLKSEEDTLKGENPASGGSILTTLLGSLETGLESQQDWVDVGDYLTNVCHAN